LSPNAVSNFNGNLSTLFERVTQSFGVIVVVWQLGQRVLLKAVLELDSLVPDFLCERLGDDGPIVRRRYYHALA